MKLERGKRYRIVFDVRPLKAISSARWPFVKNDIKAKFASWANWHVLGVDGDVPGIGLHVARVTVDLEMIVTMAGLPTSVKTYAGFTLQESASPAEFEGPPPAPPGGLFDGFERMIEELKKDAIVAAFVVA